MVLNAGNILLVGAVLLFVSILAGKAGSKFGVPVLLLFLGVGMVFGSDGLGIQFNSPTIAQFIGMIALSVILFSGGMDTKFKEIRPVLGPGIILATLGVMITTAITGGIIFLVTRYFFGSITLTLYESLLLAAVISSTDSASVFSILRSKGLRLKENLRPMLEFESGSNDPMANILTILFIQVIQVGHMSFGHSAGVLLMQIGVGAVAGYVLGRISLFFVNRLDVDNQSQYPILLLALVFFIFSFTDLIGGNGYLAVYLAGLVIGNSKMPHHRSTTTFFDGIAWLAQLVMFLTLGLLVNPTELLPVAGIGLLIAVAMILIARPATVYLCLLPFRKISGRAKAYVSWVGLRGADHLRHLSAYRRNQQCQPDFQHRVLHHDHVARHSGDHRRLYGRKAENGRRFGACRPELQFRGTARRNQVDAVGNGSDRRHAGLGRPADGPSASRRRTGRHGQARRRLFHSERSQQALSRRQAARNFPQRTRPDPANEIDAAGMRSCKRSLTILRFFSPRSVEFLHIFPQISPTRGKPPFRRNAKPTNYKSTQ